MLPVLVLGQAADDSSSSPASASLGLAVTQLLTSVPTWAALLAVVVTIVVASFLREWYRPQQPVKLEYQPEQCGDITLETLAKHDGSDFMRPIYFAVRGKVYDVTPGKDFYGPGGGYHILAGKEVARALATMSLKEEDCCDRLDDLTEQQLQTLADWEKKFDGKYGVVGQVVPMRRMTRAELAQHDGSDPSKPMLLAIRGTVFDITTGKQFYGPDGMYPFAGHECARAFALLSTETSDCNDNLEGLGKYELDTLRDWEAKFHYKYPIVGTLVKD